MRILQLSTLLIVLCYTFVVSAYASSPAPLLPQDQPVAKGFTKCMEDLSSCTNFSALQSAWRDGMNEAQTTITNFLKMIWQLIKQAPLPAGPPAPAGLPPACSSNPYGPHCAANP